MSLVSSPDLAPSKVAELLRPLASDRGSDAAPLNREDRAPGTLLGTSAPAPRVAAAAEVEALYRRHHRFVFRLALRYGKGNTAWAEDVTQDVFVDLFKIVHTLHDLDDMEGWL